VLKLGKLVHCDTLERLAGRAASSGNAVLIAVGLTRILFVLCCVHNCVIIVALVTTRATVA